MRNLKCWRHVNHGIWKTQKFGWHREKIVWGKMNGMSLKQAPLVKTRDPIRGNLSLTLENQLARKSEHSVSSTIRPRSYADKCTSPPLSFGRPLFIPFFVPHLTMILYSNRKFKRKPRKDSPFDVTWLNIISVIDNFGQKDWGFSGNVYPSR